MLQATKANTSVEAVNSDSYDRLYELSGSLVFVGRKLRLGDRSDDLE